MTQVKKQDGTFQEFNEDKLIQSIVRAGGGKQTVEAVIKKIRASLYEGMSTREIFSIAFKEFHRVEPMFAPKYDLKNALMRLGVSGFPFEQFISRVLMLQGFSCETNLHVKGKNIKHEIDVSARKGDTTVMVECKHFTKPWLGCHIQTALYVYARFLDVNKTFNSVLLATNTTFSPQVIQYAKGVGLELLGWKYPENASLEQLIDTFHAYPVTMLRNLPPHIIEQLHAAGIIMLSDLCEFTPEEFSKKFGVPLDKASRIFEESAPLCAVHARSVSAKPTH